MPIYDFKNSKTQESTERVMSIADMEQFLVDNPEWGIQFKASASIGDSVRLGIHKTPPGFRSLLKHIKDTNIGSTVRAD